MVVSVPPSTDGVKHPTLEFAYDLDTMTHVGLVADGVIYKGGGGGVAYTV